jgi:hypothetical protein
MDAWMDAWTDGWMDGWIDDRLVDRSQYVDTEGGDEFLLQYSFRVSENNLETQESLPLEMLAYIFIKYFDPFNEMYIE